ncbi:uncharacterized protein C8Q71DRAFT_381761 [Rhodofomes roseus]|uniref:Uncharacterized protein n=1 Tax=Rhodofomes roseus TaxID=34475 RepID=A0ABQ8K0L2_9APHY|nr:uncharacterized protein C8Q71DRAFT_381761 [Rhodofomes roseus]KAH9830191.1 hypothetical protein C8Q71DRAFT_381761 [Rhodofomes roseus]
MIKIPHLQAFTSISVGSCHSLEPSLSREPRSLALQLSSHVPQAGRYQVGYYPLQQDDLQLSYSLQTQRTAHGVHTLDHFWTILDLKRYMCITIASARCIGLVITVLPAGRVRACSFWACHGYSVRYTDIMIISFIAHSRCPSYMGRPIDDLQAAVVCPDSASSTSLAESENAGVTDSPDAI